MVKDYRKAKTIHEFMSATDITLESTLVNYLISAHSDYLEKKAIMELSLKECGIDEVTMRKILDKM